MIQRIIKETTSRINSIQKPHPIRVGIDGPSASGKTTFSDQLADFIRLSNKSVIRASIDGFHNPPDLRYRTGKFCPVGYLEDSFNKHAVIEQLLQPLGPKGNLLYRESQYDFVANQETQVERLQASPDSILIFEGVMLFCDVLHSHFDFKVYIDTSKETIVDRALSRDRKRLGGEAATLEKYERRYLPGQAEYAKRHKPRDQADLIIDNDDYSNPCIVTL